VHAYLDSSALLKLVHRELESDALEAVVSTLRRRASSELARVEVLRGARRHGQAADAKAQRALRAMTLRPIDEKVIATAISLDPPALRSLDAIHLATALSIDDLDVFISYDTRLNAAAAAAGLNVESPA
jgi:predicted nucleic acid-binding protein